MLPYLDKIKKLLDCIAGDNMKEKTERFYSFILDGYLKNDNEEVELDSEYSRWGKDDESS